MTNDDQYVPSEDLVIEAWKRYSGTQDARYARLSDGDAGDEARRFLARVRRDAQREAYTTARSVLAGEDTVEWARGAHGSSMSYPHAIGIMDDLIEDLDGEVSP